MKIPRVDILIITALSEELQTLKKSRVFEQEFQDPNTSLTYYFQNIKNSNGDYVYSVAIICLFEMGNLVSGIEATKAIQELKPAYVFMYGLAGGIRERVNLGDVIIASKFFYYEQSKVKPDELEIRPQSIPADAVLKSRLANFAPQASKKYSVKLGPFAIGEKIIADTTMVKTLLEKEPKLVGLEMESFGVALATNLDISRPRFIAIRGVSDYADEQKDDNHREEALNNAADFLYSFLEEGTLPASNSVLSNEKKTLIAIHHTSLDRRSSLENSIQNSIPQLRDCLIQELAIDQIAFYKNGSLVTPFDAFSLQKDFHKQLDGLVKSYPNAHVSYFGLAHIPFIFHLGYETNAREVQVFSSHRQTRRWEMLSDDASLWPEIEIENLPEKRNSDIEDVVLGLSISYPVLLEQIADVMDISSIPVIQIGVDKPTPDLVSQEKQLDNYAQSFHQVLAEIRRLFPTVKSIHVFYSGPPTLAFRCGQQINKTVDPNIIIYNFSNKDTPNYGWALNLQKGEVIDMRESRQGDFHV
jgi:nucleoside phosphorylase